MRLQQASEKRERQSRYKRGIFVWLICEEFVDNLLPLLWVKLTTLTANILLIIVQRLLP